MIFRILSLRHFFSAASQLEPIRTKQVWSQVQVLIPHKVYKALVEVTSLHYESILPSMSS